MADAMETLKGLLGDDAEDKIKNVMDTFSGGGGETLMQDNSMEYLMQMKDIVSRLANSRDDPRSNLLLSLKPYMSEGRRQSIDRAVHLLNLTKLSGILKFM